MKTSSVLLILLLALAACKKEAAVLPKITPLTPPAVVSTKPDTTSNKPVVVTNPVVVANNDTIPDDAGFRIKLVSNANANDYDEALFFFNKKSNIDYDANEDAAYFAGYGQVSLSSVSKDGQDLSIYKLPYTYGMSVKLNVKAKTDGTLSLAINYERNIPSYIQIWVKDNYLKDSVDVRSKNYTFNVSKADPASFGDKRFTLVIKDNGQQQTQPHKAAIHKG